VLGIASNQMGVYASSSRTQCNSFGFKHTSDELDIKFCSNRQTDKKKCDDCTVRMDADVAGPYDTWQMLSWQGRATRGRRWLVVVWTNHFLTCGIVANGLVTSGPNKGRHVSPG
jgi:hypothetical protein